VITDRHGRAQVYCYRGRQAKSCNQPTVMLGAVEEQLAAYLASFHVPEETVALVVKLYERAEDQRDGAERRWREIGGRSNASLNCTRGGPDA
jgi:hypothetical protein